MPVKKTIKQESFDLYKSWRAEEIVCPAFNEKVHFTLLGWNLAGTIQAVRTINNTTTYGLDSVETIKINGTNTIVKVRVIIVDTKTGKKFLSIMDRKLR